MGIRAQLTLVLAVLAAFKLTLLAPPNLVFPDEEYYLASAHRITWEVGQGNFAEVARQLFEWKFSRPTGIATYVPAAALGQLFSGTSLTKDDFEPSPSVQKVGTDIYVAKALFFPNAFFPYLNLAIHLLVLTLFFGVARWVFAGQHWVPPLLTLVYGLLANSNVYLRHVLSYDAALVLAFAGILTSLHVKSRFMPAIVGLLCGLSFSTYPGYYWLPALVFFLLLARSRHWKPGLQFALGAVSVLFFWELVARAVGISYFEKMREFQTTITQGDFQEGFSFFASYLLEVEGAFGLLLLIALPLGVVEVLRNGRQLDAAKRVLLLGWFVAFLYHASSAYFFSKFVFYGRILHSYLPFALLTATVLVLSLKSDRVRKGVVAVALGAALVSTAQFTRSLLQVLYPTTTIQRATASFPSSCGEWKPLVEIDPFLGFLLVANKPEGCAPQKRMALRNPVHPLPGFRWLTEPGVTPKGYTPVIEGPHYMSLRAYQFEGYGREDRSKLQSRPFLVGVYQSVETAD